VDPARHGDVWISLEMTRQKGWIMPASFIAFPAVLACRSSEAQMHPRVAYARFEYGIRRPKRYWLALGPEPEADL
jgi:hypothetical protein